MMLHTDTNGSPLRCGFLPHPELPEASYDAGSDHENRVVIIGGRGNEFSGPRTPGTSLVPDPSIERIVCIHWERSHLPMTFLDIEVPIRGSS